MSSFIKFKGSKSNIPGVKASSQSGQSGVTSFGNLSLDSVLGGGQEINSVFMIGEDKHSRYSKVLLRYYLAEGIANNHKIFFADFDQNPREFIKEVPVPVEVEESASTQTQNQIDSDLRIAFRYSSLPKVNSEKTSSSGGNNYDLSKKYEAEKFENLENVSYCSYDDFLSNKKETGGSPFDFLYERLRKECDAKSDNNLFRICLNSIGSPYWYTESFEKNLVNFLKKLKSLVRYHENTVCLLILPTHLIETINDQLIYHIRNLVDCNINLESFDESTNPYYKEYNGQLFIKKLQTVNSLQSTKPETYDLAFKLKRNRFLIEKLHLPQVLLDSDLREEHSVMGCSSNKGKLDF